MEGGAWKSETCPPAIVYRRTSCRAFPLLSYSPKIRMSFPDFSVAERIREGVEHGLSIAFASPRSIRTIEGRSKVWVFVSLSLLYFSNFGQFHGNLLSGCFNEFLDGFLHFLFCYSIE